MELKFSIDTDDLYGDEINFESLLTDTLQREIIKNCKKDLASDKFGEFAVLASNAIIAHIKLKMENFLSEDIALTEGWGKPTFVGSIEDLIKKRFDDILLRPVDGSGKTLQGCSKSPDGKTWIEWRIKSKLDDALQDHTRMASDNLKKFIIKAVDEKLVAIKDQSIKDQVDSAFVSILKQKGENNVQN